MLNQIQTPYEFSREQLRGLSERFFTRDTIQAELIYLLGQLRQMDQRASELPQPDGVLLHAIVDDLDERVSSRLGWLLSAEKSSPIEKRPLMVGGASACHVALVS